MYDNSVVLREEGVTSWIYSSTMLARAVGQGFFFCIYGSTCTILVVMIEILADKAARC